MRRLSAEVVGRGPRLALVHGFTQTARSWAAIANRLAADHEVVAVDAPGHGGSAAVALDLTAGADALVDTVGPATYVGYSMGARLCLHAALAHPDAVRSLVLIGVSPGIADLAERDRRRADDEQLAAALEHDGVDAFLDRWLASPLFAHLPPSAAGLDDRRRNTVAGLASSLRLAGTGTQADLRPRLSELRMPVLVVAGELDAKFRDLGAEVAARIGDNATFSVVAEAGHSVPLERPEAFVNLLRTWLAAQPPSANPTESVTP